MVSKSAPGRQGSIKEFRHNVAKLKALGLVSKRVDARSQRETRYMKSQIKRFNDVLEGRAKVVHAPKRSEAAKFSENYRVKGKSIVVPVERGEKLSYRKKNGAIVGTLKQNGERIQKEYLPKTPNKPAELPTGSNILYTIPLGGGLRSFDTPEDLFIFMQPYETDPKRPYKHWQRYLIIEHISRNRRQELSGEDF